MEFVWFVPPEPTVTINFLLFSRFVYQPCNQTFCIVQLKITSNNDCHRDIVSFLNLILKTLCFSQTEVKVQFKCHGNNKNMQFFYTLYLYALLCCRTVLELQLHVYTRTDVAPMHHIPAYTWVQHGSATGPTHILPQISWSFHLHTEHCSHHNAPAQLQLVSVNCISFLLICKIGIQTLKPWVCFWRFHFCPLVSDYRTVFCVGENYKET
jgi:hypothetical protein